MIQKTNTILITGGSSGLGLEMARQFIKKGNLVIICSRTLNKLQAAKKELPELEIIECDISYESERLALKDIIEEKFPQLNILVNNAAITHKIHFVSDDNSYRKLEAEIATNVLAPIHLSSLLFPILSKNRNPNIINITTGLIYVPRIIYPFYNATKAALHSFTKVLRSQLENEQIRIIEVMFPAVDTPWHNGNPPAIAISARKAVSEMMLGLEKDKEELRIGAVKILYLLYRIMPGFAYRKINSL